MTRIIEFLIALGIVAGLFVVVGLVLPSERQMSESVETNRRMTIVYDTVNSFRRFKDWNPLVLRDPKIQLKLAGPEEGKGARVEYSSTEGYIGNGSWEITNSVKNERVEIAIEDPTKGYDKVTNFTLVPTGKNNKNVKITQDYSVKYGWNLFGRYAGLYVSRHVGDDLKLGLSRLATALATVPNFDYRAELDGKPVLSDLKIVDVPAEDLLVVTAGNIDRDNETIKKSIKDNQEWIKRVMDSNGLEAAGPVRIVTTDFASDKYAFDVAQPVRKRAGGAPKTDAKADTAKANAKKDDAAAAAPVDATPVAATGDELKLNIPSEAPVKYQRVPAHRSAFATYAGHMAGLDAVRNSLRAWAATSGMDVTDRPYEAWKGGVDKSFTQDGTYDVYWAIK
ncbi:SRPBCC family protein [Xanthomonas vasicola]|uniref:SRPBCC family protein n=1 Tax=Xanthomonas vasicola TaxID=56459 RepID=UPI0001CC06E0|nr:SRPBCC family protein [Xanthomonas vasicola]KFA22496.1 polyketide cyclase [Xanthomonas vasicola pv. musacearum NCPPB 4384]AZR31766.1 polyketide cyclase [Xanthomonas vasicola pv. musacearum NCPPB 4379]KFA04406.1 polyketide cyclase [Xanthomonas vasicola pv. musacearum NCPPB 2005]KFA10999.1 polyketide cyclase [Xanthomonas vasicola pv. musacearum NCPPB 4380]KFA17191.1 polyketide cyclase [Xanthomonas vasicola pv. musacearum NCPPB 4394]